MTAQTVITLWHRCSDGYERLCCNAHVVMKVSIEKSGIKEKGFHSGSQCRIRIPSQKAMAISPGDYMSIGEFDGEPDIRQVFRITEVCDNRRGGEPHYKMVAQR